MVVFGHSRKVRDPNGEWWYVRATKSKMPAELLGDPYARNTKFGGVDDPLGFVFDFFATLMEWLILTIVRLPFSLIAKLASPIMSRRYGPPDANERRYWIQANTMYGSSSERRFWVVTGRDVDGPFAEIVAGLAQGKVVHPTGAEYKGSHTT
jgi:hypothetical protein